MMAAGSDNELERLRAARMAEMQSQIEAQAAAQVESQLEAEAANRERAQVDMMMKQVLTPDARSRLANLSLVDESTAMKVKTHLADLSESKIIAIPVTDEQLKNILRGLKNQRNICVNSCARSF